MEDRIQTKSAEDVVADAKVIEAAHLENTVDRGLSERQEKSISLAMKKWQKMKASRDMDYLDEHVKLRDGITLCLSAIRISREEVQEEIACNGFSSLEPGEIVNMELYVEDAHGRAIDGVGSAFSEKDVRYLVQMYGRSPKGPGRRSNDESIGNS